MRIQIDGPSAVSYAHKTLGSPREVLTLAKYVDATFLAGRMASKSLPGANNLSEQSTTAMTTEAVVAT